MDENTREFRIRVKRRWPLWTWLIIAFLAFVAVLVMVLNDVTITGVSEQMLVLGGTVFFLLIALFMLPLLMRRKVRQAPRAAPAPETGEGIAAPVAAPLPQDDSFARPLAVERDEYFITGEVKKGLSVVEYNRPAKSDHIGAPYVKTYVPVTDKIVVRIETMAVRRDET